MNGYACSWKRLHAHFGGRPMLKPPPVPPNTRHGTQTESALFAWFVERVMQWPCPRCGQTGLCGCFSSPIPADAMSTAVASKTISRD